MSCLHSDIRVAAIEYALPSRALSLEALAQQRRLKSSVDSLRSFGFERAWVADGEGAGGLALRAAQRLLDTASIHPETIDLLCYASASPQGHAVGEDLLGGFSYPVTRLQYDLGLVKARTIGVSQAGCVGLMTAISVARAMMVAEGVRRALCVSVDVLPEGSPREILYNLISDGACAVLLERGEGPNRIVVERHVTKGYYWDCEGLANEIVAAYFPTATAIIRDTLLSAGLKVDDIALIVPHNVSLRSWEILLQLTGFAREQLFGENICAKGHVIGGDNFINLKDAQDAGRLRSGDKLLLFNFGFGASWHCMLIEH